MEYDQEFEKFWYYSESLFKATKESVYSIWLAAKAPEPEKKEIELEGGEFTMRIPAECDRDADLVLSEASRRIKTLSGKTHIVWLPNTGVMPSGKAVLIKTNELGLSVCNPATCNWSQNIRYPITEYAIIEE